MTRLSSPVLLSCTLVAAAGLVARSFAAEPAAKTPTVDQAKLAAKQGAEQESGPTQASVASKTAKFATLAKTDKAFTEALDAHDLAKAKEKVGKPGSFKGKIDTVYHPKSNGVVVLDFDPKYSSALTAVVMKKQFAAFPDLDQLKGKEVVVTGKFSLYHEKAQLVVEKPAQIKLVK